MEHSHKAWRYLGNRVAYVESADERRTKGDPYSYTSDMSKAVLLTERQCRTFCGYMKACGTVGFWS